MGTRKMTAFDPERATALEKLLRDRGILTETKKMFGHESHFLNGYMYTGANVDGVFVHLGQDGVRTALETEKGVRPFGPMEGMVMKDYLLLDKEIADDAARLTDWLETSRDYLMGLPPKSGKKPKRKK